jgi:hypothetical protein
MKICKKCGKEKSLEEFHIDVKMKDGRKSLCKSCRSIRNTLHRSLSDNRKKFDKNINSAIYRSLKTDRRGNWERILDFNLDQLKEHLQKQFTTKMLWNNYGSYWWVDKIIPRVAYNYQNIKNNEFHKCWSLKNLRPLSRFECARKGNKVFWELVEQYKLFDILPLGLLILDKTKGILIRNELDILLKAFVEKMEKNEVDKDLYIKIMDVSAAWNKAEILNIMISKIKTFQDYEEEKNFDYKSFLDLLLP